MKSSYSLYLPPLLLAAIVLVLWLSPGTAAWASQPAFAAMPYLALGGSLLLGLLFTQTRIAFVSLFLAAITFLIHHAAFVDANPAKCQAVVFFASALIPGLAAWFYRSDERGVATPYGSRRAAVVLGITLLVFVLTAIRTFGFVALFLGLALLLGMIVASLG